MLVLVNGLLAFNAGKTSVAAAILRRARAEGLDMGVLKPRSAHNYWEHYDHSRRCQELGLLVSRDALELRDLTADPPPPELVNPHHQLLCPLDLLRIRADQEHLLGRRDELILAERLTGADGRSTLFLNRRPDRFVAPEAFVEALTAKAHRVVEFTSSPVEEGLAPFEEATRGVFEGARRDREHLVVESFSDVVLPVPMESDEVDLVVSVGGSLVLFFRPTDLARAMEVVRSQRMSDFLRYLKPLATFRVPHLTAAEREAELDTAYGDALDALWSRL